MSEKSLSQKRLIGLQTLLLISFIFLLIKFLYFGKYEEVRMLLGEHLLYKIIFLLGLLQISTIFYKFTEKLFIIEDEEYSKAKRYLKKQYTKRKLTKDEYESKKFNLEIKNLEDRLEELKKMRKNRR